MIEDIAIQAKHAAIVTASLSSKVKNRALRAAAHVLLIHSRDIISANQQDLAEAEEQKLSESLLNRLKFDNAKLKAAVGGIQNTLGPLGFRTSTIPWTEAPGRRGGYDGVRGE